MEKQTQPIHTSSYKMIIPSDVEGKIRHACNKVWSTEWSGTLFYTYKGSFEENNLVIICKDFFIMDIGSTTYTEFDMSPDVAGYLAQNPELLECQMGLIHSHNNMATFFSGTDQGTLKEEGKDRQNFVSLIVNNAGTYTAAITRQIVVKKHINKDKSYSFFGRLFAWPEPEIVEEEEIEVEAFYLNIEKEEVENPYADMDARLEEIKEAKAAAKTKEFYTVPKYNYSSKPFYTPYKPTQPVQEKAIHTQSSITFPAYDDDDIDIPPMPKDFESEIEDIPYGKVHCDKDCLNGFIKQLITGSVLMDHNSNIDPVKWSKGMSTLYIKRFGAGKEGLSAFNEWLEVYLEYLITTYDDPTLEADATITTYDEVAAICAYEAIEELKKLPVNEYIKEMICLLKLYLL